MAEQKPRRGRAKEELEFVVLLEGEPEVELDTAAYAFDPDGELLTSARVDRGSARLLLADEDAARARIVIGPSIEGKRPNPTLAALERLCIYEPAFQFDAKIRRYDFRPVPEWIWRCWQWCSCRVRGRVVKPVTISAPRSICQSVMLGNLRWRLNRSPFANASRPPTTPSRSCDESSSSRISIAEHPIEEHWVEEPRSASTASRVVR
jgi:hypothetical protein